MSVLGQSLGDEAASDKDGGGATATEPKGPDAADDTQGAVDPPPREDDAAVVRGGWEADMEDAPPPIHGSNTAVAAFLLPLILLLAVAAAVPTLSSGCKREAYINWHVPVSIYIHSACLYTLYQGHAVCTLPLLSVANVAAPRVYYGLG
ncbi:hypothetical protein TcCL_Unassigned03281 [Trypanosoma cruzi]|nr:hypothetical protein TcCL_Unassigned03281 [Trypanosoma cruzi]